MVRMAIVQFDRYIKAWSGAAEAINAQDGAAAPK
jgi:hypothetical protein